MHMSQVRLICDTEQKATGGRCRVSWRGHSSSVELDKYDPRAFGQRLVIESRFQARGVHIHDTPRPKGMRTQGKDKSEQCGSTSKCQPHAYQLARRAEQRVSASSTQGHLSSLISYRLYDQRITLASGSSIPQTPSIGSKVLSHHAEFSAHLHSLAACRDFPHSCSSTALPTLAKDTHGFLDNFY